MKLLFRIGWLASLAVLGVSLLAYGEPLPSSESLHVSVSNGRVTVRADQVTPKVVLERICSECGVECLRISFSGTEKTSFFIENESVETVLRKFLQHLEIPNFAFEYDGKGLRRIIVAAAAEQVPPQRAEQTVPGEKLHGSTSRAVQVVDTLPNEQAAQVGIENGDVILEYDGIPVESAHQLREEALKRPEYQPVDLVVLREGRLVRVYLSGGFIGVRIKDIDLPGPEAIRPKE